MPANENKSSETLPKPPIESFPGSPAAGNLAGSAESQPPSLKPQKYPTKARMLELAKYTAKLQKAGAASDSAANQEPKP